MPTFPLRDQIHTLIAVLSGVLLAFHPFTNGTAIVNEVQTIAGAIMVIIPAVAHILAMAHVRVNGPAPTAAPLTPATPLPAAAPQPTA